MRAEFEIDHIVAIQGQVYVLVREVDGVDFVVSRGTRLGEALIRPWLGQPRALDERGRLREDLLAFALKHPKDRTRFCVGERVMLETVEVRPRPVFSPEP